MTTQTTQTDHEPCGEAYLCDSCNTPFDGAFQCPSCGHGCATKEPVYTTPAQRTWIGLTEREVDECYELVMFDTEITPSRFRIYQAIEAKLKEKNT